jgi:hypothetical protein
MSEERFRILIGYRGGLHKLATFRLMHSDGSFYLNLTREGTSPSHWTYELSGPNLSPSNPIELREVKRKGIDISYHSSGLVRYKNASNKSIACEPLHLVTQHFCFAKYSVPSVAKLDSRAKVNDRSDSVFAVPDDVEGRMTFSFFVSPLNDPRVTMGEFGLNILFPNMFSVNCVADRLPVPVPAGLEQSFIFMSPTNGLRDEPALSPDQAAIVFHQILSGATDLIVYPPNSSGEYRIVFSVEMRVAPQVRIAFADPQYSAEVTRCTKGSAWFKVRDNNGHVVKRPVQIGGIELNARLF